MKETIVKECLFIDMNSNLLATFTSVIIVVNSSTNYNLRKSPFTLDISLPQSMMYAIHLRYFLHILPNKENFADVGHF